MGIRSILQQLLYTGHLRDEKLKELNLHPTLQVMGFCRFRLHLICIPAFGAGQQVSGLCVSNRNIGDGPRKEVRGLELCLWRGMVLTIIDLERDPFPSQLRAKFYPILFFLTKLYINLKTINGCIYSSILSRLLSR